MNVIGLLLAAGSGRRFDPSGAANKLLAPLPGGDAVVVASARAMLSVFSRVIAVVPAEGAVGDALRALGCDVTVCIDAGRGMAVSLVHGLQHSLPDAEGWVVALGDMPCVAPATIAALRAAIEAGAGIAAPVYAGRRGNPVAFGAQHVARLLALQGDQGARALLALEAVTPVMVDDPGVLHDIDTRSDLHKTVTLPLTEQVQRS